MIILKLVLFKYYLKIWKIRIMVSIYKLILNCENRLLISKETSNQFMENKHHHTKQFLDGSYDFVMVERASNMTRSTNYGTYPRQYWSNPYDYKQRSSLNLWWYWSFNVTFEWNYFSIIHDSLKLWKVTYRWVPHFLTEQKRKERVEACHENLRMF